MLRRDTEQSEQSEQSRLTTQPSTSTKPATSPSLVLDTTTDGVENRAGTVPADTEFPDFPKENVSSVSTLPNSEVRGVEVEDGSDPKDMEESDKNENGKLCTISRNTNVESSRETVPVLAETTRPADGPAPVLKTLPDLHVERTVEENGAGDGNRRLEEENVDANRIISASDEIETDNLPVVTVSPEIPDEANDDAYTLGAMPFHEDVDASRIISASAEIETDNLPVVTVSPEIPDEANDDTYTLGAMPFHEDVDASRIISASAEIETDNLPVVTVSPEIPSEANDDAFNSGAMPLHEASSTDIITVSSVENADFDSCSLAHGQVSNMMSHVDFTAVGGEQQETSLAYHDQDEQIYSTDDRSWISCGICGMNIWKLVFVPCGHRSCVSCYKRLTKCHICRNRIDSVVKALLV